MINVTPQQLQKLRDRPTVFFLVDTKVNGIAVRMTTSDLTETYDNQTYLPGLIDQIDTITVTSNPAINDFNLTVFDADRALSTSVLASESLNEPFRIIKVIADENRVPILTRIAFQGFLTQAEVDFEGSTIDFTASSVWADFRKVQTIRTNPASQQRYFPNDTAFEHAAKALDAVYWGKNAPGNAGTRTGTGTGAFADPNVNLN